MASYRTQGTQNTDAQRQAAAQAAADRAAALAERQAEFRQREADRAEAQKTREQTGREAAARNLIGLQSLRQARKEGSATRSEQQKDRDAAALEQLVNSGMLAPNWEKTASPIAQAARNKILQEMGLNPAAVAENANLATMRAEVAKTGRPVPGQVPAAQVPAAGTPLPQTPTQGPASSGDDAMDRAMIQAASALAGGGQQVNPVQAAAEAAGAAAVQRREALAGAGPVHYDPNIGANVRSGAGGDFVVGAPDPSVGAAQGAQFAPLSLPKGTGTAYLSPDKSYQELGVPRSAAAARFREAWQQREGMTPFKPAALAAAKPAGFGGTPIPGEQAGLPAGYKQLYPPAGQGTRYDPVTGRLGPEPATNLAETALPNIQPATTGPNAGGGGRGVGLLNQPAPPGTPEQAPPGSVYGTAHYAPQPGTFRAGLEHVFGPIRFGAEAPYSPTDLGKPNAWTVPPYMRGPNAGVPAVPETQHQFAPSNLATPPTAGTGPFGHPVPAPPQQPVAQTAASALSPEQRPPPLNQQQPIQPIRPVPMFL